MFEVRPNRPDEGLRIVSIWRAAVTATHEFLSNYGTLSIDGPYISFGVDANRVGDLKEMLSP
jgi:hypothetical protein